MVHILLMILKVIGIVLLVLLILVLFFLLSLLFVPVGYQSEIHKKRQGIRNLKLRGKISWMFGGVSFRFVWEYPNAKYVVKIFGKRVYPPGKSGKNKKHTGETDTVERGKNPEEKDVPTGSVPVTEKQNSAEQKDDFRDGENPGVQMQITGAAGRELLWEKAIRILGNLSRKAADFIRSVFRRIGKVLGFPFRLLEWMDRTDMRLRNWMKCLSRWKEFLSSEPFRESIRLILRELTVVWKALKPRKIQGEIVFGLEDPAETGQMLGMISLLYPSLPAGLRIVPVFEQSIFEAEVNVSGHICGITLVRVLWRLYRDRNIRIVYSKFQNKEA